jgi:N4-gp56 family major capsid protein
MAVDNFKPEVWNAGLLSILDKALVFGSVANRNYEGDISEYGDTVHITDVDDVTIGDYTPNTDLADPEVLTTNEQLLVIDQAKSFHFYVDDVDARQVRNDGALMDEAGRRAAFGLRDKVDTFLSGKVALSAGNHLGVIDGSTVTNVYDKLVVPAGVALDEANVPEEMRWLIISPAAYGLLQLDSRFIEADKSGTTALHNGVVGMAGGFRILKSNNAFQANRAITASIAVATTAKTLTGPVGTFSQGDIGLTVTGTNIAASTTIASVNADGSVATMDKAGSAAASQTDTVISGGGQLAYAGSTIATTYADQILKTVAYSPEKRFGDAVKGLHVYGAKVIRPEALVVASVKVS